MRQPIRVCSLVAGTAVIAALILFLCSGTVVVRAGDAYELYQIIPENVDSFVYLRDLKGGLGPFLKSDYYDDIRDLEVLKGPIKDDLSAPFLTRFGDLEKSTGFRPTLKRILWIIGDRAVFYTAPSSTVKASAGIFETGWFRAFVINLGSILANGVTKEDWGGYSVWAVTMGDARVYYKTVRGYTIFSNSPDLFKSQWDIINGQNPSSLSGNPEVMSRLSGLPGTYHILYYSTTVMAPAPDNKGIGARMRRLLSGTDALAAAVTFTDTGVDVVLFAPMKSGDTAGDLPRLGALPDKMVFDFGSVPGETAAVVVFRAFDPDIVYTHFSKSWFGDVTERVAYIATMNKWKEKGGFDFEGGIVNNLGRGAAFSLVGLGWDGEKPRFNMIASMGVRPGGEAALSENLAKMFSYSFFDAGPTALTFVDADISYMGTFREKTLEWNGTTYIGSVNPNPGFSLWNGNLYLFWNFSTIERLMDLAAISSMTKTDEVFGRDYLAKSTPFVEAQKKMPVEKYDLYCYVDGNNAVSLFENYLVNLSANYTYFLYQDSEKRLVPLLELTRRSFVSCYGGINFGADAVEGAFTLTTKDLD